MSTSNKTYYGLFYKDHGRWTGPYKNIVLTAEQIPSYQKNVLPRHKARLKSKTTFRKLRFA